MRKKNSNDDCPWVLSRFCAIRTKEVWFHNHFGHPTQNDLCGQKSAVEHRHNRKENSGLNHARLEQASYKCSIHDEPDWPIKLATPSYGSAIGAIFPKRNT